MRAGFTVLLGVALLALGAATAGWLLRRSQPEKTSVPTGDAPTTAAALAFEPRRLGQAAPGLARPLVTHLQIVDLDRDGLNDVIYAEASTHTVRWLRQGPRSVFTESIIGEDLLAPAHVWAGDINGDGGGLDVLVASLGQLLPTNDRIGSVVALEHEASGSFRQRVLLAGTARVADVRGANLSGHADARLDLVVGQFGYAQGEIRVLANRGGWQFEETVVNGLSGCVHTPVADFNGDGRVDFAALIAQEWEEVHLFLNQGGTFTDAVVWGSTNEDYGSSGLAVEDVNRDGRPDLLYTNGDGFDYPVPGARPWHGLQWLENTGGGRFTYHRVGDLPGAYSPRGADLDGDGDIDLVAVSPFADWSDPKAVSLQAWINDGRGRFRPVVLAHRPTHLVTCDVGDLDGDGAPEIVTGGLYLFPPYTEPAAITVWHRR